MKIFTFSNGYKYIGKGTIESPEQIFSKDRYLQDRSNYIIKKRQLHTFDNEVLGIQSRIIEINERINLTKNESKNDLENAFLNLQESLRRLETEIENWQKNHVLRASINGKVSQANFWNINQFAKAQDKIIKIVPQNSLIQAHIKIKSGGLGKIEKEQNVFLRLNDYPHQEFGEIETKVNSIPISSEKGTNPKEDSYLITINLPKILKSSRGKILDFKPGMSAEARIVTKSRSFFQRLFDKVFHLISKQA